MKTAGAAGAILPALGVALGCAAVGLEMVRRDSQDADCLLPGPDGT